MKLSSAALSILILALITVSCSNEEPRDAINPMNLTKANSDFYAVGLSGQNEVPTAVNVGGATGKLFLKVNDEENRLYFLLYVDSLKNITKATINYGTKGYEGPPIVNLYPDRHSAADSLIGRTYSGVLNAGFVTQEYFEGGALEKNKGGNKKTISDLIRIIKNDSAYVEIHTRYHRDGAIRAHIKPSNTSQAGQM